MIHERALLFVVKFRVFPYFPVQKDDEIVDSELPMKVRSLDTLAEDQVSIFVGL